MAINSKNKGSTAERALCKILKERWPDKEWMRVPASGARLGQSNKQKYSAVEENVKEVLSGDIICPSDFKFSIESKCYADISFWDLFNESSDLHSWMKQCSEDAAFANKWPLLVVKINRHKHFAATTYNFGVEYVFEHRGFYFYNLEEILKLEDGSWFDL